MNRLISYSVWAVAVCCVAMGVRANAQAATGQNSAPALLRQSAGAQKANIEGSMREVVSAERVLSSQPGAPAAWRNRIAAHQRLGIAFTQLLQAQGNPSGLGTAISGAFRELQSYDQALMSLAGQGRNGQPEQYRRYLQSRNSAQIKLDNLITRWNAQLNAALPPQVRSARQGLTNNVDGSLRELEGVDRQLLAAVSTPDGGATGSPQPRVAELQQRISQNQRELQRINHQGATKAAQDRNRPTLERQIDQDQRELARVQQQQQLSNRQAMKNNSGQEQYLLQNRANALDRFRLALDRVLDFDSRL